MKFGEQLSTHLTPEWRKQYIRYDQLKKLLYDGLASAPNEEEDAEGRAAHVAKIEERFLADCAMQLNDIDLFFKMKLADAERKHNELRHELEAFKRMTKMKPVKAVGAEPAATTSAAATAAGSSDRVKLLQRVVGGRQEAREEFKTLQQLKFAFSEFYLSLVLLQNFQQLNATGFRKILKKHDKLFGNSRGLEWRQMNVERAQFYTNNSLEALISQTEAAVINELEKGNRREAMKRLRVPPLSEKQSSWTTFRLGFFLGCFVILTFLILIHFSSFQHLKPERLRREPKWVGVRLFRGFLLLFANIWLMGLNVYGWQEAGVNHVLIFEIDPRHHLTYQSLMEVASFFCMLWAACVLGYMYVIVNDVAASPLVFPLLLMALCLLWLLNPLKRPEAWFRRSSRYWFLKHVFCCFTAPLHAVTFAGFWLGDQMNSLVTFFLDVEYFLCFYLTEVEYLPWPILMRPREVMSTPLNATMTNATGGDALWGVDYSTGHDQCFSNVYGIRPLISLIPATVRFLQCLRRFHDSRKWHPHLVNAGKYATSYFVVALGVLNGWYKKSAQNSPVDNTQSPVFYFWVLAYVVSFMYTFSWDVFMDWSLMDRKQGFLREELIYSRPWYYYFAIGQDFVLRLSWVLNVSLGDMWIWNELADIILCVTGLLECFRRFIWNYLRLENEHVNNCGQFRAVRDISLKPIRKAELEQLLQRIDAEDGVTHRAQELRDNIERMRRKGQTGKKARNRLQLRKFSRGRTAAAPNPVPPGGRSHGGSAPPPQVERHSQSTQKHSDVNASYLPPPSPAVKSPTTQDDTDDTAVSISRRCAVRCDGVELNPVLVAYARCTALAGVLWADRPRFYRRDLWKVNLSPYDAVVFFGTENEHMMQALATKLSDEKSVMHVLACRHPMHFESAQLADRWRLVDEIGAGVDCIWMYRRVVAD